MKASELKSIIRSIIIEEADQTHKNKINEADGIENYYKSDYIRIYKIDMNYGWDIGGGGILKVDISWFENTNNSQRIDLNNKGKAELKRIFPDYDIDYRWKFLSKSEYNKHIQEYLKKIDSIKKMIKLASAEPKKFK